MDKNENKRKDDLHENIEKAVERGVSKALRKNQIAFSVASLVIVMAALLIGVKISANSLTKQISSVLEQFGFDNQADNHDLVIDDNGILGYTAADFEEAILGNSSRLKKLEVYQQEVSDLVTITDTGLLNISAFTKSQCLTYHGTATYTVDLSKLNSDNISVDNKEKLVCLTIPHSKLESINIPESDMEFSDTTKGILAFGEIKMTQEESAKIQAEARSKMEEELIKCNAIDTADRMAILSVWEMYSPIIKSIAKAYTFEVRFAD